jgi:hypothetical protein
MIDASKKYTVQDKEVHGLTWVEALGIWVGKWDGNFRGCDREGYMLLSSGDRTPL